MALSTSDMINNEKRNGILSDYDIIDIDNQIIIESLYIYDHTRFCLELHGACYCQRGLKVQVDGGPLQRVPCLAKRTRFSSMVCFLEGTVLNSGQSVFGVERWGRRIGKLVFS